MVDQERHPDGYNDRNPDVRDPDFKYDNYGNLIADRDKEIKEIVYNHLNLPVKIIFENGGEIDYIYACPPFGGMPWELNLEKKYVTAVR
ncbi:hypothetical protein [Aequorivita ciconiae]|uniref:hypothetical protein n=1 Tax=Aequorivita ciconiae TaxID=2494375 RepID=UPI0013E2C10A|nr:hypothetical protein [Aequorivita sp. H23M31]